MIKIYEQKVFWVLVFFACFVLLLLGSVKICQIISEVCLKRRNSRVVVITEDRVVTVYNQLRDRLREENLTSIKQSDKNLAPPLYSTLSKASASSTYELPPPYPFDYI